MHKVPAIVEKVVDIALRASDAVIVIYAQAEYRVVDKADEGGPLTEADLASNRIICLGLNMLTPDIPILSEESPWKGGASTRYWAVDPLDGTKEFLKRNGEFTVNIALVENGRPTLGVVMAPVSGEAWVGVMPACSLLGNGECTGGLALKRNGPKASWQPMQAAVTINEHVGVRVVGSRSHPSLTLAHWLAQVEAPVTLVEKGSSIKLCLVAEGAADVYPRLGPTSIWDTAAGHAVALASGAAVMELNVEGGVLGELFYRDATEVLNPFFMVAAPAFMNLKSP